MAGPPASRPPAARGPRAPTSSPPPSIPAISAALEHLFDELPGPVDHVMVTGGGERVALAVARNAVAKMRPGGTLELMDGALAPRFAAALGVALAPMRIRVVAPSELDGVRQVLARAV